MKSVMGKVLWVDLGTGEVRDEAIPDQMYSDYIGGYGIGARFLYDRMPANIDAMGPENILGFMTGPLTGTAAITGNRFTVMAKSPKTETWGDANCGGTFGPALKFAGYDGVFFTGISERPVYLFIDNGTAELRDAADLWNQGDDFHPELTLKERHGKQYEVAWIGRAGETCSLTAAVMNDIGRAAGRSGLGAVMGSKRLKAIVAGGKHKVEVHDEDGLRKYVASIMKDVKQENSPRWQSFSQYGTTAGVAANAASGDSPVKNWAGVGIIDFPEAYKISDVAMDPYNEKRTGCWRCNIACTAHMKVPEGKFASETHRPEYETLAAAGTMTLTADTEMMMKFNEIVNFYGMDTITAGSIIAYAMECYERGLISGAETDGVELTWGNADAVIAMTHKLGKREGRFAEIFGDGVAKAAQRLGGNADEFAVHVHGEEVPMHDPRYAPGLALTYQVDATPARHTQGGTGLIEMGGEGGDSGEVNLPPELGGANKYDYNNKGMAHHVMVAAGHIQNTAGVCLFAGLVTPAEALTRELELATGEAWPQERVMQVGSRIAILRHAFNLREGLNPAEYKVPSRILDGRPLAGGPLQEVLVDNEAQRRAYFQAAGWDADTSIPSVQALQFAGLPELVPVLHGAEA